MEGQLCRVMSPLSRTVPKLLCSRLPVDLVTGISQTDTSSGGGSRRNKRHHNKTRTGCRTCRERRVKCDEGTPDCANCVKGGRLCVKSTPQGKTKATKAQAPRPLRPKCQSPQRSLMLLGTNQQDARNFDFFRTITAPELTGYHHADSLNGLLLQLCHQPEIWHTALAVGVAHEQYLLDFDKSNTLTARRYILQHYNIALKLLRGQLQAGTLAKEETILCCILFATLEVCLNNWTGALAQLRCGYTLLRIWEDDRSLTSSECRQLFDSHVIPGLDYLKAPFQLAPVVTSGLPDTTGILDHIQRQVSTKRFHNTDQACFVLARIRRDQHRLRNLVENGRRGTDLSSDTFLCEVFLQQNHLSEQSKGWMEAFKDLERRSTASSQHMTDDIDTLCLLAFHKVVSILIANTIEPTYENYTSEFEEAVQLAEQSNQLKYIRRSSSVFTFQTHQIISTLLIIALHCHEARVLRRALALVQELAIREKDGDTSSIFELIERINAPREGQETVLVETDSDGIRIGHDKPAYGLTMGNDITVGNSSNLASDSQLGNIRATCAASHW